MCQEGGTDSRLSVVIELVLSVSTKKSILNSQDEPIPNYQRLTLTNLRTSELWTIKRCRFVTVMKSEAKGSQPFQQRILLIDHIASQPLFLLILSQLDNKSRTGQSNSPSKTSLNWANLAPGRAPAAALEAIVKELGDQRDRKEDEKEPR